MSGWRGPRRRYRDPIYHSPSYRRARAYYKSIAAACAICHYPINYAADALLASAGYHLDHHPMGVREGRILGWTDEMLNSLANTRPTHRLCNIRQGASKGARIKAANQKRRPKRQPGATRKW